MKILTSAEMAAADSATFERIGVPSRVVMEVAGRQIVEVIAEDFADYLNSPVLVAAGGGNNGGDGFVVARTLLSLGVPADVVLLTESSKLQGDARANYEAYIAAGGNVEEFSGEGSCDFLANISSYGLIVDAILGTGFKGEVRDFIAGVIDALNEASSISRIPIVSIDLPSGINADTGLHENAVIFSHATVALQCPKVGNILSPKIGGRLYVVDIGVSPELPEIVEVKRELVLEEEMSFYLRMLDAEPVQFHKGDCGHALIVGGSKNYSGAPVLSGEAALKSGAGVVTLLVPDSIAANISNTMPELICRSTSDDIAEVVTGKGSLCLGPGLGTEALPLVETCLQLAAKEEIGTVIDADALNIISQNEQLRPLVGPHTILTPHPGEMARLLECSVEDVERDRLAAANKLSTELFTTVVLKGARTIIACPDGEIFINPAAVSSLATAGSGDVLAGLIAGFVARNTGILIAAKLAVFLHGAAGERLKVGGFGPMGATARDITNAVVELADDLVEADLDLSVRSIRKLLPGSIHYSVFNH